VCFFFCLSYEKGLLIHRLYISDDGDTHPTRSPSSVRIDKVAGDSEVTNSNEGEAGVFDEEQGDLDEGGLSGKEEVAKDGDLGRRSEDVDSVMCMEREKVSEGCEMPGMWDDFASV
jgi:hypothetical protein